MTYPQTEKVDHVDTYHGVSVPDPYRWLEDDRSAETAAWVEAQNAVTFAHLDTIPFRATLTARLEQLFNYPKFSEPVRRGTPTSSRRTTACRTKPCSTVRQGLDGAPEVLLDPNTLSPDGTTKLGVFSVSKDGALAIYGLSEGGSDWLEYRVLDVATKQPLSDVVEWVKVSGAAWAGKGFFYSRYPASDKGKDLSAKNVDHQVFYHRIGTPQSADELVYQDAANPERFHTVEVTEDERFAILTVSDRGKGKQGNAVFYRDLASKDKTFTPLVAEIGDDTFTVVDNIGDRFLVHTDHQAPNGRVFLFDPKTPAEPAWQDVLPERPEPLDGVGTGGGKIFATYLKDVTSRAYVFDLTGKQEREIALPGPGTVTGLGGRRDDAQVFYTYTSFNYPPTIFRYDVASGQSTVFRSVDIPGFTSDAYEVNQVFVTSKDGTKVPVFLTHKKGLQLNGQNPTLMYGYGGFNITTAPAFSALRIALLEQGFVYASVNLRGGAEYGEAWHLAGTKLRKQNVFDDFIAAAEWLIEHKYTVHAEAGDDGRLERRPARGRGDEPAAGSLRRGRSAGGRDGHAALPHVHDWLELDCRLRLERQRGGVQGALRLFAAAQPEGRHELPAHARDDRRPRRPRGAGALVQVRGDAAGAAGRTGAGADPHRHQERARGEQHEEADREHGRHLRVRDVSPGRDAEAVAAARLAGRCRSMR